MVTSTPMAIATVERETGIGKDTLRVWERRYGFPQPLRDINGERLYPPAQVEHLQLIKRLMNQGHRPGRLFSLSAEARQQLADTVAPAPHQAGENDDASSQQIIALLKSHDVRALALALRQAMLRQDLEHFVLRTVVSLNHAVGEAWMRGELEIFEEHLYSEQMKSLLRQAINSLPSEAIAQPRILLTTVPEEQHTLGLLMAECLLTLAGASCISLGTQTPLADISRAAAAHGADIVALSFSPVLGRRQCVALLNQLRAMLPPTVELWAGGMPSELRTLLAGVIPLPTLDAALSHLRHRPPPRQRQ
jgi:DNA-binding transcriptional MerR regulator/methylmalonyl-CoA mutase cobalamin-binding subunit